MIAYITGTVHGKTEDAVIILTGGIGYRVFVPGRVLDALVIGADAALYTHHNIREDAAELFGFVDQDEYSLFIQLLKVSGVGPKMAVGMISAYTPAAVRGAIVHQDIAMLTSISGIGKKTAERIVVELKDSTDFLKGAIAGVNASGTIQDVVGSVSSTGAANIHTADFSGEGAAAAQALIGLGYTHAEVAEALATVDRTLPIEEQVRLALKAFATSSR